MTATLTLMPRRTRSHVMTTLGRFAIKRGNLHCRACSAIYALAYDVVKSLPGVPGLRIELFNVLQRSRKQQFLSLSQTTCVAYSRCVAAVNSEEEQNYVTIFGGTSPGGTVKANVLFGHFPRKRGFSRICVLRLTVTGRCITNFTRAPSTAEVERILRNPLCTKSVALFINSLTPPFSLRALKR